MLDVCTCHVCACSVRRRGHCCFTCMTPVGKLSARSLVCPWGGEGATGRDQVPVEPGLLAALLLWLVLVEPRPQPAGCPAFPAFPTGTGTGTATLGCTGCGRSGSLQCRSPGSLSQASVGPPCGLRSGRARVSHAKAGGAHWGWGLAASCRGMSPLPWRVLIPVVLGPTSQNFWGSALCAYVGTHGPWSHPSCQCRRLCQELGGQVPGDGHAQ